MLYLVRHGQTACNAAGQLQGRLDSPLTTHGIEQTHTVGEKLKALLGNTPVGLSISPLGRTQETAAIIGTYLNCTERWTEPRIAEIGLGDWEGMTLEDIEFTHPGALDGSTRHDWAYRAPGGEQRAAFLARLADWLDEIINLDTVLVAVSHGWAGLGIRSIYTEQPFDSVSATGDSHTAVFELSGGEMREF